MTTEFVTKCCYIMGGLQCENGLLYHVSNGEAALLEGASLQCPSCDGRGVTLTPTAKQFIVFLQTHGRPFLRELIQDIMEETQT